VDTIVLNCDVFGSCALSEYCGEWVCKVYNMQTMQFRSSRTLP